jgi:Ca2+-binding EF-hand superfamily protein
MLQAPKNLDLEQIRKGFEMFDIDQTGKISPSELLEAYDAMNLKDKNPFIYNLISSLSEEHEEVAIDELVSYIDKKLSDSQSQEGLNLIFDSLCEPNEDSLTLGSLPHIAKISEDRISEKELRYLLERTQMGGDEIDFEEFYKILKGNDIDENKENENRNNGHPGGLKLSSGGKGSQPQPQIYKKKASNKAGNENNKLSSINSKKNLRKDDDDDKNKKDEDAYDFDDISESRKKGAQKNNTNNISNNNDYDLKKNDKDKFVKEVKVEKEKEKEKENNT